jgi:hypothetical protein
MERFEAEAVVLGATGRDHLHDALRWVAEGRRRRAGVPLHLLLRALVVLRVGADRKEAEAAIDLLVKSALRSEMDTSVDLVDIGSITPPHEYRRALTELSTYTASRSLADVTCEAVAAAQAANQTVVLALCQVAGLTFRDLGDRVSTFKGITVPGRPQGPWSPDQIAAAFHVIDEIVRGHAEALLPGGTPARPVEMLLNAVQPPSGWEAVDNLARNGVPYEVLLAQRAVGGAWLAHRNHTASQLGPILAEQLCELLDERRVGYWRGVSAGGKVSKKHLGELIGDEGEAGQVSLVTKTPDDSPSLAIAIAFARDGGTARKSAGRLLELPKRLNVPSAVVILGPGWSIRGETAELIPAFDGRLFTERTLTELSDLAVATVSHPEHILEET